MTYAQQNLGKIRRRHIRLSAKFDREYLNCNFGAYVLKECYWEYAHGIWQCEIQTSIKTCFSWKWWNHWVVEKHYFARSDGSNKRDFQFCCALDRMDKQKKWFMSKHRKEVAFSERWANKWDKSLQRTYERKRGSMYEWVALINTGFSNKWYCHLYEESKFCMTKFYKKRRFLEQVRQR